MGIELGHISAIFRYRIKSMAGERLDSAKIGWHGVEGDRRLAFRRLAERGAFPWLIASRLPELLLYEPVGRQDTTGEPLPTHVRTPDGREYGQKWGQAPRSSDVIDLCAPEIARSCPASAACFSFSCQLAGTWSRHALKPTT